ncbi:hypothetical protein ACJX0J_017194, partial [Zea mays]
WGLDKKHEYSLLEWFKLTKFVLLQKLGNFSESMKEKDKKLASGVKPTGATNITQESRYNLNTDACIYV